MRTIGAYEAKTHLPRLLDEVAGGEVITITKHGQPVAILVPATTTTPLATLDAIAGLREFRAGHRLRGVTIRELINEGRDDVRP
jgi:prevent-host-death family protein